MAILSDSDYVGGKPRIEGHRLWVSHIVEGVLTDGLEGYIKNYSLEGEENKIKEAIDYCRKEQCVGHAITYCQGCSKREESKNDLWNLWTVSGELYKTYFEV